MWLVEIVMPKSLMSDIRTGSIELEDETVDLQDLDDAYSEDLDQQAVMDQDTQQEYGCTNQCPNLISTEGLGYKDLAGMLKNTVYIDDFSSKMGDDDEIVVASFYVRDHQAAMDLVNWFEKGYDFIMDADMSPGEVKPNRYLVYVEMKRRSYTGENLRQLVDDFDTLTEYEGDKWVMGYKGEEYPFTVETYNSLVPQSPQNYREREQFELNEMRIASRPSYQNFIQQAQEKRY